VSGVAGGTLLLQDLLIVNASLASPIGNPSLVLLPTGDNLGIALCRCCCG
jgi:hypothetical protein